MRSIHLLVLTATLALLSCTTPMSEHDTIDLLMRPYAGEVPGASVFVARNGEVLVSRSWGYADLETGVPVTPATNFRLASVTKQFTATAILLLAQDGQLSLDDPVKRWLPSLPPSAEGITIRHLLTHVSGLADYEDLIPESAIEQVHDADVLRMLVEENPESFFEPGDDYRYSNTGYALLALIVERVSSSPFPDFLEQRIFAPLGMGETVAFREGWSTISNRAFGHSREDDRWVRDDQSITSAVLGDGGIYTSIIDLEKWNAALDTEALLEEKWREMLFTPAVETDRDGVRYGFGWRIDADGTQWHTGSTRGFRNVIVRSPAEQLTVVVLSNRNEGDVHAIARRIAALY